MLKLKCDSSALNEPIFARVTKEHIKRNKRSRYVFVGTPKRLKNYNDYQAIIINQNDIEKVKNRNFIPPLIHVDDLQQLNNNDVIQITPQKNEIIVYYESQSSHNGLFLTDRCNSKCIMCPQRPKPDSDDWVNINKRLIDLISPAPEYLTLSGGEPTLLDDALIELINACRISLPQTKLMLLTNGRKFKDLNFVDKLAMSSQGYMSVAVPIYADTDFEHDKIVGVKGALRETLNGCSNLALYGFRVEIRVVIIKQNYKRLKNISDFIYRNISFASHVAYMGMEVHDLALDNFKSVWIDPYDYQQELFDACKFLFQRSIPVSIYNHQLCIIPKLLWPLSQKSISTWKNIYLPKCSSCSNKADCGGFFSTSADHFSDHIRPF